MGAAETEELEDVQREKVDGGDGGGGDVEGGGSGDDECDDGRVWSWRWRWWKRWRLR